ncbi:MAG: hypothetical protein Q8N63_02250 [Nanoarchaeota archaeon]|nr:hypothetical protein [Nanoarchaeota archaeon]
MEFKSFKDFKEHYFPNLSEREKIENMNPDEYGGYIARKLADEFKSSLEN